MDSQRDRLATAIDIRAWLAADAATAAAERVARDRRIGMSLAAERPRERVLAWWRAVERDSLGAELPGERVASLVSIGSGILLIAGIVAGVAIAGAAFAYRGDNPVNLFALLGILVGIPLAMLVVQVVFLRRGAPLPASIRDAIAVLSPARWMGSWLERRFDLGLFASITSRGSGSRYARWQLVAFGQSFAIGFFLGALAIAGLLVIFTDLAFGWSTTLDVSSATVFEIFNALALPWHAVLPAAAPDLALVEASRWFRLEDSSASPERAAALGRWWPFVTMVIAFYGLLPRLVLAIVASRRVAAATDRLLVEGPETTALLDRLETPRVAFDRPAPEPEADMPQGGVPLASLDLERTDGVIVWNDAVDEAGLHNLWPERPPPTARLAEQQPDDERRAALDRLDCRGGRILVLAKGWEPPMLSFLDLISLLRRSFGSDATIVVVPLDTSGIDIAPADREVWANALARHDDPALFVADAS